MGMGCTVYNPLIYLDTIRHSLALFKSGSTMIDYANVTVEQAALTGMAVAVHAANKPDEIAVVDSQDSYHWDYLNKRSNQLANYMRELGLGIDDSVALLCSNRVEFVEVMMASFRSGIRVTPINWHLTGEEISYIVENCDAKILFADGQFAVKAAEAAAMVPELFSYLFIGDEIEGFSAYGDALGSQNEKNIDDPVHGGTMLYTSGTTGRPKGVFRVERPATLPDFTELGYPNGDEVDLCTGPAYHAAPLLIDVLTPIISGATVVFMDGWDPEESLRLIDQHKVTHCHMVATMFHRLLQLSEETKTQYNLSSMRMIIHGAAPCPVHVKHAMIEWVGPVLVEYYAATEGGGGFLIGSEEWLTKPGSVGKPGPEFDNRIVDETGERVKQGEVGTIYMRAPEEGRFIYYKDKEKTESSYAGDYFTLGDMGFFDEDGYLFLTGRTAELIISGGVNIYPQEVDSQIMQHAAVLDVCTIGVPSDEWGEEVKSVVQLNEGFTGNADLENELVEFSRSRLPAFKCPRSVDFVPDLPRLPTGKIQRRIVREPYWEGRDKSI
jgi:long-chain acyl-CoA synthetase